MKLSKNLGRIATTFLATAMLASLTAVPAFATTDEPDTTNKPGIQEGTANNQFTIQKTVDVKENSFAPAVTVNFTVEPDNTVSVEEANKGIEPGLANGVKQVSPAAIAQGTSVSVDGVGNATFEVDLSILNHAAVYKYKVKETAGQQYAGMTFSSEEKTLYVHVVNDGNTVKVAYTELVDSNGTSKSNNFTNYYGTDDPGTTDEEEDPLHDLTVKKIISGDGAYLGDSFDFTIAITGDEDVEASEGVDALPEKFSFIVYDSNGDPKPGAQNSGTILGGSSAQVSLANGEYVVVYGLSEGDAYTITESEAGENGYTTSVTTGTTSTNGTATNWDKNEDNEDIVGQVSANSFANDAYVTYTNERPATAPTGIVMNVAPYALLVVIAAAGCFVFLRKRRED